ncbi:hypothetical protein [Paenibacillus sp. PL91]|uniref:hypothetical protein n=1 Tax=Paenibacillus sp. PL91 TaxID=2729538 RepID=UPI00145E2A7B|nr:hypothetical protein [Paenibacillus sp. PL91]MBC9204406.1 hypothetical protein [Paenibacillus sp. PL91]
MRRYWLSIIIVVLAISGIGTYYSFGRLNHLPEYRLETIQGDSKEGAAVQLLGGYRGDMNYEYLEVNTRGSEYGGLNKNLRVEFSKFGPELYRQADFQQLLIDHKSFMRGKNNENGFYRDEEWVIYSDVSLNIKKSEAPVAVLQLNLLHEATDKITAFKQTFELPEPLNNLYIEDVQRLNDRIYILVNKYYNSSKPKPREYEVFELDLANGKLLGNEKIDIEGSDKPDIQLQLADITTDVSSAPTETIFFIASEMKVNKNGEEEDIFSDKLSEKYYSFSYRTGLMSELPEMISQSNGDTKKSRSLQVDYLYFAEYDPEHLTLKRYNPQTKKYENAYATVSAEQLGVDEIKKVQFGLNRLYILFNQAGVPGTAVIDISNGKLLFTGRAAVVGDKEYEKKEINNLLLTNMKINETIKN